MFAQTNVIVLREGIREDQLVIGTLSKVMFYHLSLLNT